MRARPAAHQTFNKSGEAVTLTASPFIYAFGIFLAVDTAQLEKISLALGHDFFANISERSRSQELPE